MSLLLLVVAIALLAWCAIDDSHIEIFVRDDCWRNGRRKR